MITVTVNDESVSLPEGCTVSGLLEGRGLGQAACAVEVNGVLAPKREHGECVLQEGDRVELVTLVGGG